MKMNESNPKIIRVKGSGDDFGILIVLNGESYWLSPNSPFQKVWDQLKDLRDFLNLQCKTPDTLSEEIGLDRTNKA